MLQSVAGNQQATWVGEKTDEQRLAEIVSSFIDYAHSRPNI